MSTVTSVEQIGNLALKRIGFPETIGNIYDGTKQARALLEIYGQTRDALLRETVWGFAERIALGVVATNPPPSIWSAAYAYPSDCLQLRNLYDAAYVADPNDPLPNNWTIANDPTSGQKVIWANITDATLVYTGQIIDVTIMEPLFVESLVSALARRMPELLPSFEAVKYLVEDEKSMTNLAAGTVG